MNSPKTIYLADYQPPAYHIEQVNLTLELDEQLTQVTAVMQFVRNAERGDIALPLELNGCDLTLVEVRLNDHLLSAKDYQLEEELLRIPNVPAAFTLIIKNSLCPQKNTSLEGLYLSKRMLCTQCEAEGFRKITYFPDRPDVMTKFTTTLRANKNKYPVLLSNGNLVSSGESSDGQHWVTWEDPFKKPCYLFALVAADLACKEDTFITSSGREVELKLYVEPHDLDKCDHGLLSLKKAMAWDEQVYGREYDLDLYMIVAVSHFNMGAMENKGLNIFNTSCVLAHQKTTTDAAFQRVEAVVAHEYFHNWSGNRVTCRDWFQLSLKEGFTVFRDQEFSADQSSRLVKRVEDVRLLRTAQFAEDAGPMTHPIRPSSYMEINNFYTVTVYEKGAEVVRMLHTLLGAEGFRKGTDLYFDRHDGQAVTTEDFIQALADANKSEKNQIDFTQFKRWYDQAGTPEVEVTDEYDEQKQQYSLTFKQTCRSTPECTQKKPFLIPIKMGLLDRRGSPLRLYQTQEDLALGAAAPVEIVLSLAEAKQKFTFYKVPVEPTPSLLRGFSAPVKLNYNYNFQQLALLITHDSDHFNRWEAGQQLLLAEVHHLVYRGSIDSFNVPVADALNQAFGAVLMAKDTDPAAKVLMLTVPSEAYVTETMTPVEVELIHQVRQWVRLKLAERFKTELLATYQSLASRPYQLSAESIGQRSLKNLCLDYLMMLSDASIADLCYQQFAQADNMTDQRAALQALVHSNAAIQEKALAEFYQQWQHEALVVDQWFVIQATAPEGDTLAKVNALLTHPAFEITNPNKVRSLIGAFCGNAIHFHRRDGAGYAFLVDQVLRLNEINPLIAARLLTPLTRWHKYDPYRQRTIKEELQRIMAAPNLAKDIYEVVSKSLQDQ